MGRVTYNLHRGGCRSSSIPPMELPALPSILPKDLSVPVQGQVVNSDGSITITITRLKHVLMGIGLPNYQIGAMAGIHPYQLSLYVQGKRDISIKHLRSLCKVLECKPEAIMGWERFVVKSSDGNTERL